MRVHDALAPRILRGTTVKIGLGTAFVLAVAFHGILLGVLAVNVSLDRPQRPEDKSGQIIHATVVNMPPAKGSPSGKATAKPEEKKNQTVDTSAQAAKQAEAERQRQQAELAKQVAAQKKAEEARQKAIALKKAEEAKAKAEAEAKRKAELKAKAEAEAKAKAEAEAKAKAEAEAKAKAEAEAKRKAEAEAKAKAEAEAKRKAQEEAKRKADADAKAKAEAEAMLKKELEQAQAQQRQQQAQANAIEDEIFGSANGVDGGQGLGSGDGSDERLTYGNKVRQLIEQNWRIDPSMNGKRVVVTITVDNGGMIVDEVCDGDRAVCSSALSTIHLIGMMPMPPAGCKDCNKIVITMTPKL